MMKKADRRIGAAFIEIGSHKEGNVLLVRVTVVVALKAGILTEVVAPIVSPVRVAAILEIYKLHGGHGAHVSSRLHVLHNVPTVSSFNL